VGFGRRAIGGPIAVVGVARDGGGDVVQGAGGDAPAQEDVVLHADLAAGMDGKVSRSGRGVKGVSDEGAYKVCPLSLRFENPPNHKCLERTDH
jgi:hypothetical protein